MPLENYSTARSPHAAAIGAYEKNAKDGAESQRELEARILLKSVAQLEVLQADWDTLNRDVLADILSYNRKIWLIFYDVALKQEEAALSSAAEQGLGGEAASAVRRNIIALARYVFRREIDILAEPAAEKLDILISINRNIAAGLMNQPQEEA